MAKKRVPDWLNSPLWSSPSEQHRFSSAVPEPPEQPPSPPPLTIKQDPPSIQHSRTNHNHNHNAIAIATSSSSSSASTSSADENSHSRQAQSQANLLAELSRKVIDMRELRRIASQGIPDVSGLRSTVWKIFLGYLPPDRGLWSSELAKKRSQYKRFKQEILINPSEITRRMCNSGNYDADEVKCETRGILSRSQITHGEHPLSLGKTSIWNQFFQDTDIIEQIDRDVKRTHPDMPFFCGDSQLAKSNQEALKNILIIFAKLNPGIRYVQGMNEVLAPLFYVFKNDPDEENAVNPQFYAFRWITLLLTQDFSFVDILRIWDTLISDPDGPQETLLRVCCAMLILVRRRLLAGDFTSNLKLLQSYPPTNISHLLHVANKLRVQPV
ncbi:TBC1 domain family member 13-like isoform X4 [Trifolium pratense]|uniref:Uncharacterized protein n=1 Tax=Trifolium pratense TaxID=57577 RepID=A0ACB0LII0_TRIPR|nr:TBC1 domain family member 13-like isoform X4 [Trifolium pratense]CAJ2668223.1 unnamed protein product [Trifolium pratense]